MVLFLNDVAGSEILVILLFVLIFFGANSIPTLAKTLGKAFRQINDAKNEIQGEIKRSSGNIRKDINLSGILKETEETIKQPLDQMTYDIENSVRYEKTTPNPEVVEEIQIDPLEDRLNILETENNVEVKKEASKEESPEA